MSTFDARFIVPSSPPPLVSDGNRLVVSHVLIVIYPTVIPAVCSIAEFKYGGFHIMYYARKLIAGALLVGVALGLGGCFHHNEAVYAEPLPPPVSKPLK